MISVSSFDHGGGSAFVIPCTCNYRNFHVKRNCGSNGGIMQNVPSSYLNPFYYFLNEPGKP